MPSKPIKSKSTLSVSEAELIPELQLQETDTSAYYTFLLFNRGDSPFIQLFSRGDSPGYQSIFSILRWASDGIKTSPP